MDPKQRRPARAPTVKHPARPAWVVGHLARPVNGPTAPATRRPAASQRSSGTTAGVCSREFFPIAPHGQARPRTSVAEVPDQFMPASLTEGGNHRSWRTR
jgi:hypothetical protein